MEEKKIAWFLRPMSEELCWEKPSIIMVLCGSPLIRVSFVARDQWASPKHIMEGFSRHKESLIGSEIKRKLKMTVFQKVGIDSKLHNQI